MKTERITSVGLAFAALVIGWATHQWHQACAREQCLESQLSEVALQTFEGEGGLVLS